MKRSVDVWAKATRNDTKTVNESGRPFYAESHTTGGSTCLGHPLAGESSVSETTNVPLAECVPTLRDVSLSEMGTINVITPEAGAKIWTT